jgi:hypothetical protein
MGRREKSGIRYTHDEGDHQVNLSSLVARFEQVEGGTDERYTDELPALELPGHGDRYDEDDEDIPCGDPIPRFCSDCGATHEVGRTCYRSRCPRCWKGWDRRRAITMTSKLEGLRRYREAAGEGWQGWKFHHLAISPPEGYALNSDRPLHRTFQLIYDVLEELGAATGYVFYHPYRGEDGDDRGFWKSLLPDGESVDMEDTREQLSHQPHFHAVVVSKHVSGGFSTKHVEERTGWVVERITKGDDSDVSIYNEYDLARVCTYCLSHTGLGENRAAYRPFGEVANFTATPAIENKMDAAVRSVAPNTLGLRYDSLACQEQRVVVAGPKVDPSGMMDGSAQPDEQDEDDPDEDAGECQGRLLDIGKAPKFLEDPDWCEDAPHVEDLEDAWQKWRWQIDEG